MIIARVAESLKTRNIAAKEWRFRLFKFVCEKKCLEEFSSVAIDLISNVFECNSFDDAPSLYEDCWNAFLLNYNGQPLLREFRTHFLRKRFPLGLLEKPYTKR
jgi:hypothetical protein